MTRKPPPSLRSRLRSASARQVGAANRMATEGDQTLRFAADDSREWFYRQWLDAQRRRYGGQTEAEVVAELLDAFRLVRPVLRRLAASDPQIRPMVARSFQLIEQIERAIKT